MTELPSGLPAGRGEIGQDRNRVDALLEAILGVGSELDLQTVLHRIVAAATTLADAQYGALGVLGGPGVLAQFVTSGIDETLRDQIGEEPHGRGLLGLLIRDPRPLRLTDLTRHPAHVGFPANHPTMRTFLGVPVRVGNAMFGNLYLTEKRGGGEFDEDDERVVVALAAAAGVAVQNARLYGEARRREQWLAASAQVTTALLSGTAPGEVLDLVARQARHLAEADVGLIALPVGTDGLLIEAADGVTAGEFRGLTLPVVDSHAGQAYRSGQPVTVARLAAEAALTVAGEEAVRAGPAMFVPLVAGGHPRGVLAVASRAGQPRFGEPVLRTLQAFAAQAAVALELAERRRDAERLSVLEDRDRIARDLHDLVIQRLFASGMQLESLASAVPGEAARERLQRVVDDLDGTIREIRSTIFALQSPQAGLPGAGLRARLLTVANRARGALGWVPSVRFSGPVDTLVPDEVGDHLVAVLGEALSNVARHARASRVAVSVRAERDAVCLRVRDDGVGLPPGGRRSGLANLAERAALLGGRFAATAGPDGRGTELSWRVPLDVGAEGGPGE